MRVLAISDQHGFLPDIPPCDLLLVAGDNCMDESHGLPARTFPEQQEQWFRTKWLPWRERQPVAMCVLTWGNHCYAGLKVNSRPGVVRLGARTVSVVDDYFHYGGLRIWCTPWSSSYRDWAWTADEEACAQRYGHIHADTDIIVSHQPPKGYCDGDAVTNLSTGEVETLGSQALLNAVRRVRPRAVVCGHIHSGHGRGLLTTGASESDMRHTLVYNVALVNMEYELVHHPTEIVL